MTAEDIDIEGVGAAVRVRTEGDVEAESLAYLREKVGAVLGRPGLPPISGEVHLTRAAAHHVEFPWAAVAEIQMGADLVVVHAREASARELVDRLHDRLRGRMERARRRRNTARRTAAPPRGAAARSSSGSTRSPHPIRRGAGPVRSPFPAALMK
ncbi:hypothetical protein GA0115260_1030224 [Streptomyces sp. MnatMP-M27]|uniref:hypothetical protein n=1 Tax=Streptomyces sp. MnatMP-M27 TaxID=1839768 RepID=UPI00081E94B7|nr:hypothetical protein [Streptomyces sp. MnatMP-M27]SCF83603.1 hypothetical protein GA0115260_1030224 [Streptomyces sp. MnatMP-M27]